MTLSETLESPSVVVQEQKYVDKQQCFLQAVQKHSSEINRLTYRLDKCIQEYEKYTNIKDSSSNNDDSLQSRKVYLLVQRMGRLRSSGLMLCHEISKCVENSMKTNILNGEQKPKKSNNNYNDVKESSCRNKSSSDYDGINAISAETEESRTHAKAILRDVEKEQERNYEMYHRSQVEENETKRNADQQNKDDKNNKLNLESSNNKSNSKMSSDKKESKEYDKLVELYKHLQSCIDKTSVILTTFMLSAFTLRATQQQLQMSSININCEKQEKIEFVQDYCPLSLIGATATLLYPQYVMCDKESNTIRCTDSVENIKTNKSTDDTNAEERNVKYGLQNMHQQEESLENEDKEVYIPQKYKIGHNQEEEEVLLEAPVNVNVAKTDETITCPALETLPLEIELSSPRIIQVNNTNIIRMTTNLTKPTCYCEDHIIYNEEEINRKYKGSEQGNNYNSQQSAHNTNDVNNKTSKESLVHSGLSAVTAGEAEAVAQKQQENAKCELTQNYDHIDTHLPSSSCAFTNNTKVNKIIENKYIAESNQISKSRNTIDALQPQQQHQPQSQEKQVEDVILSDIQHAIHSMKSSAIKVSEIIQHEQSHFTLNAELLTKQVHSTEGNIQQINKLSAIRQSHSGSCMLWLEKLPAGKLLMHSFLLPLWNVVKQIVYFTVILICTLLTLFLMTIFHKPHSYRLHHTANLTAGNTWSAFDANKLINNVINEYSGGNNTSIDAYYINIMRKDDNIVSNFNTTSNLRLWNLTNPIDE